MKHNNIGFIDIDFTAICYPAVGFVSSLSQGN